MPANNQIGPTSNRKQTFLIVVALAIVLAAAFWLLQQSPDKEEKITDATVAVETSPSPARVLAPPTPADDPLPPEPLESAATPQNTEPTNADAEVQPDPLPNLDQSDAVVLAQLTEQTDKAFTAWLTQEHLIRKFVRAVNALEEGKLVNQYRPVEAPKVPFQADKDGETLVLSPENYARYTPYIEALERLGGERLTLIYQQYYPLLEQAYLELGVDKGDFSEVTERALQAIVAAPTPAEEVVLVQPSVMYLFKDPEMEQLPATQKLMLRMGPENSERLQVVAKDILAHM